MQIDRETRREVSDRYFVALTTPHLRPRTVLQAQEDAARLLALDRSPWLLAWAASFIHQVIATLPAEDPWRRMAGRCNDFETAAPGIKIPEGQNGARSRNGRFGSVGDALDLARLTNSDLSRDPRLAPVADPLRPDSAVLLAAAGRSATATLTVLAETYRNLAVFGRDFAAEETLDALDASLRWSLYRRAQYCGFDDPWPPFAHAAARDAADHFLEGRATTETGVIIEVGQIDSGTYEALRSEVSSVGTRRLAD